MQQQHLSIQDGGQLSSMSAATANPPTVKLLIKAQAAN
jgi:hypothetical protein